MWAQLAARAEGIAQDDNFWKKLQYQGDRAMMQATEVDEATRLKRIAIRSRIARETGVTPEQTGG
jgi:hypothetical protein